MKKLISLMALGAVVAGCGVQPSHPTISTEALAPSKAPVVQAPVMQLAQAPSDPDSAAVPLTMPSDDKALYAEALKKAKTLAEYGPLVTDLDTLEPSGDEKAYGTQTSPQRTQQKADEQARAWAPDAKQLWIGWGFKTLSWFGHSRHVYFSAQKRRLLTIDYGFWGNRKGQYETTGLVVQLGGRLISALLREPRDVYPVSGREAYNRAQWYGYQESTRATVKVLMIDPIGFGPQWIFLDGLNKPRVLVDANTGDVRTSGLLIELLGYLF